MASGSGVVTKLMILLNAIFPQPYRFPDTCSLHGESLKVLKGEIDPDFDVVDAFEKNDKVLGKGGFGEVKKIKLKSPGYRYAAVKKVKISESTALDIGRELYILNKFGSANIATTLLACVQNGDSLYLVLNLIKGKSLAKNNNQKRIRKMLPSKAFSLFLQGYKALEHLFVNNIVHNDIKPDNVLINQDMDKIYLADFGLASFADIIEEHVGGTRG